MFVQFITFQCVDLFRDITLHLQYCKYPVGGVQTDNNLLRDS